jgi:hypothetical protein
MDVTKVKAALNSVQSELSVLYKSAVAAGESDGQALRAIRPLSSARKFLDRARGYVDDAVESAKPKEKKAKADKKSK